MERLFTYAHVSLTHQVNNISLSVHSLLLECRGDHLVLLGDGCGRLGCCLMELALAVLVKVVLLEWVVLLGSLLRQNVVR